MDKLEYQVRCNKVWQNQPRRYQAQLLVITMSRVLLRFQEAKPIYKYIYIKLKYTFMSESISGMVLEYETEGGYFFLCISETSLIH
jgi:hypothetical protein